jgi:hypothetical protein
MARKVFFSFSFLFSFRHTSIILHQSLSLITITMAVAVQPLHTTHLFELDKFERMSNPELGLGSEDEMKRCKENWKHLNYNFSEFESKHRFLERLTRPEDQIAPTQEEIQQIGKHSSSHLYIFSLSLFTSSFFLIIPSSCSCSSSS